MFSDKVVANLSKSSWIRAMFEEGEKLRKIHGADKVYDFSLGNPDIEPPKAVLDALKKAVMSDAPKTHGYMSNAGYMNVRESIAERIKKDTHLPVTFENIVMSCGAGGAMNTVLKALLNPDDEVIVLSPYFAEYLFYIDNHGGKSVIVETDHSTFQPDPEKLYNAVTRKTKAVIINSPNNPSGAVYGKDTLMKMAAKLSEREKEFGTDIYILSDEPYHKIVYDGVEVTQVFTVFKNSIIVDSFSKSLSLPGERIGYIAINPGIGNSGLLLDCIIFATRTLGFVNAPALFQRILPESIDSTVEVEEYGRRRDMLYDILISCGYKCLKPKGAFYLFPETPIPDDVEFCKRAVRHNLVIVPGKGFGCPGHFRLAYCVDDKTIKNSKPAFEALADEYR
jgi:aspartate aminotransferase